MRAADLLIQTLESLGNRYLFSLSGNQIMSIYDAWIDSSMELIHVRHEAAAVHMADAWGQLTGTPGVALVTAGPGFANTLSALYDALMAESPLLLLSGNAALKDLGHAPFQEMNQVEMAKSVTKASWMVKEPAQIGQQVQKAMRLAMDGRTGPVHLCLPVDVLKSAVGAIPRGCLSVGAIPLRGCPSAATFAAQILAAIRAAERPLILAGAAVMRSDAFRNAQTTFREAGLVGMQNPRGIFEPSLGAFSRVLAQADLLVLLGKKLDFTLKMGQAPFIHPDARLIQVDHDAEVLELSKRNARNRRLLLLEQGNPEAVLSLLSAEMQNSPPLAPAPWAAKVSDAISFRPSHWNHLQTSEGEPLHPAEVGRAIDKFLSEGEKSLLIVDGGEFGHWMRASTTHKLSNGPAGCIGSVIPFALAARLAVPSARIVVCTGDGGFGFHPFELDTAVRYKLPFVVVIGNDACWNAEYQVQLRDYGAKRIKGIHLLPTAYHEIARHLGGWGRYVDSADELHDALVAAHQSGLPACLNVPIKQEAAPKIESWEKGPELDETLTNYSSL